MVQYKWKPWKPAPTSLASDDANTSSNTNSNTSTLKNISSSNKNRNAQKKKRKRKPKAPSKPSLPVDEMDKDQLVRSLQKEHPIRTLDIGTLNANATRALVKEFDHQEASKLLPRIKTCFKQVAHIASNTKRLCQRAIGQFVEEISSGTVDTSDRYLLDKLCPRVSNQDMVDSGDRPAALEQDEWNEPDALDGWDDPNGQGENFKKIKEYVRFLGSLLIAIHNRKIPSPSKKGMEADVRCFLLRVKKVLPPDMGSKWSRDGISWLGLFDVNCGPALCGTAEALQEWINRTLEEGIYYLLCCCSS